MISGIIYIIALLFSSVVFAAVMVITAPVFLATILFIAERASGTIRKIEKVYIWWWDYWIDKAGI